MPTIDERQELAKKADLLTKQNTLTPGTGITIVNDVISATGTGGSTVTVSPSLSSGTPIAAITVDGNISTLFAPTPPTISVTQTQLSGVNLATITVNGTPFTIYAPEGTVVLSGTSAPTSAQGNNGDLYVQYTVTSGVYTVDMTYVKLSGAWVELAASGSEVEPNPQGATTATLSSIGIDGTNYAIESGSTVVPNPTGTAVGSLTSIGIDGDKYTIEGGSSLPDNYDPTSQYLKITTPNQYNELGWAINDDTYYTESTDGYYVGDTHVTKSNALPALGGSVINGYYQVIYASTDRTAVNTSGSSVSTGSFSYLDHTWYYNASGNLMSKPTGVPYMGNIGSNYVNISKKMIDESGVYFASYQNTFTQVGTPLTGHLFSGGGTQSNLSDATFDVETDGTVHGTDFQINDVSVMAAFTGATSSTAGVKGMVPAPASGDQNKFLQGDGTWGTAAKEQELTFAEYQSLTPAQQEDGTTYYINDLNMNGSGDQFRPVIYSEAEMEIGVWTDGKPLYQKTISLTNVTLNVGNTNVDVSYLNADKIIGIIDGYAVYGTTTIALPFGLGGSYAIAMTASSNSNITIVRGGSSLATTLIQFTLRYTKTTDQPGSGTWTPQGVPAIHYSTEEQVVGMWIDGSTIYKKTLYVASLNTGDNQITHNINNFNRIINAEGSVIRGTGDSAKQLCIPYASPDGQTWSLGIYEFTDSGFLINVGSSYNSSYSLTDCYVTIRYTKTNE